MTACVQTKNPFLEEWKTPYGIPPFDQITLADYIPAVKAGIEQQEKELQAILDNPEAPTFKNTIDAYEYSGEILDKVMGVLSNLQETDGNDEMEKIAEEATELLTKHENSISMNKKFFERVKAIYDADQSVLTREQQLVLKNLYKSFTRNGVDLDEASQERLKEINVKIAGLQQKFGTNLLAENNAFKEKFGTPVSSYTSEMTSCEDRARREEMFKAYSSRGNNGNEYDNKSIALEILKLRAEKARMLGFDTFAAYVLDDQMAGNPATVDEFLDQIQKASNAKAKQEVCDMQKIMDEDIAAGKGLTMDELLTEMEHIISSGTKLNIDYHIEEQIEPEHQEVLMDYWRESESGSLDEAYAEFEDDPDYTQEEIRLMRIKFLADVGH